MNGDSEYGIGFDEWSTFCSETMLNTSQKLEKFVAQQKSYRPI